MKIRSFALAFVIFGFASLAHADCPKFAGDYRLSNRGCTVVDATELSQALATPGHAMDFSVTSGSVSIHANQGIRIQQMMSDCSGFTWSRTDESTVYTTIYPKSGETAQKNGWFEARTKVSVQTISSSNSIAFQVKTTDRKIVPYHYPVPGFDLFNPDAHAKPYWENEVETGAWTISPDRNRLSFHSQTKTVIQGDVNMRQQEISCEFERVR